MKRIRVNYVDHCKSFDMDKLEQLLRQEVEDFKQERAPVINVLRVIDQREACLNECIDLSKKLSDQPVEQ